MYDLFMNTKKIFYFIKHTIKSLLFEQYKHHYNDSWHGNS